MSWRTLHGSWLDTSEHLACAGRQLADNLDSLGALVRTPDLLSELAPIPGLHAHLIAAQTEQVDLLVVLAAGLVQDRLSSLLADLERLGCRHRGSVAVQNALQSLLGLYAIEHVRLSVAVDELQRAVRVDRDWARAAAFAGRLQSGLGGSPGFDQVVLELAVLIP